MRFYLEKLSDNSFDVRLDNDTFNSKTGETLDPHLLTVIVHNTSGMHHLNNWIQWQNNLLRNQQEAINNKAKKKPQFQGEPHYAKGNRER